MTYPFQERPRTVVRISPNRLASVALLALLAGRSSGFAQMPPAPPKPSAAVPLPSSLPATQSTERDDDSTSKPAPDRPAAQRFHVEYEVGQVAVDATNASLNQVVREVARKASIKVTGNVADERVFGHYGPSNPSVVLAALLDGTGSNMLLVSDANGASELILTPRRGTVSPPAPNAAAQEDSSSDAAEDPPAPQYVPPARTFQPPFPTGRGPVNANSDGSPGAVPEQPQEEEPADGSDPQNAQKTPQQIYEQLQKMMQQRQSATPSPSPETPDQ